MCGWLRRNPEDIAHPEMDALIGERIHTPTGRSGVVVSHDGTHFLVEMEDGGVPQQQIYSQLISFSVTIPAPEPVLIPPASGD